MGVHGGHSSRRVLRLHQWNCRGKAQTTPVHRDSRNWQRDIRNRPCHHGRILHTGTSSGTAVFGERYGAGVQHAHSDSDSRVRTVLGAHELYALRQEHHLPRRQRRSAQRRRHQRREGLDIGLHDVRLPGCDRRSYCSVKDWVRLLSRGHGLGVRRDRGEHHRRHVL